MKKLIALILALTLLPAIASAATVTGQHTAEDVVYLGAASNTYIVASDEGYQIFAADGTAAGPVWDNMGPQQNGAYYQVLYNGGICIANAKGELVLADNYFGFVTAGTDWLLGVVMEETTAANADYTAKSGAKMNVLRADVAVGGKLVGSLTREQYLTTATAGVLGDYLYILHEDGRCLFFDKALNQTAETWLAAKPSEEYTLVDGKYIHVPTQQAAFCAESTLTEAQATQTAILVDKDVIGLQGQVLFTLPDEGHLSASVHGDYVDHFAFSGMDVGHGLWDLQGKLIIPCRYDLSSNKYSSQPFFLSGYEAAMTMSGDLYFYDTTGAVTASVTGKGLSTTGLKGFSQGMPILAMKEGAGYTLISATHGVLPGVYEDIDLNTTGVHLVSVCQNGLWGCVGLDGTAVVPFAYKGIAMSNDGTLVMGQASDGSWTVYNIAY